MESTSNKPAQIPDGTADGGDGSVPPRSNRMLKGVIRTLLVAFAVLAAAALGLSLVPQEKMKVFLRSAVAERSADGSVTHPTEHGASALLGRLPIALVVFVACAAALAIFGSQLERWLLAAFAERQGAAKSVRDAFPQNRETWWELGAITASCGIGLLLRLWHIRRGIRYDEASTYFLFVSQPLSRALSNYSYPNNHILHTLFAWLSIRIFGDTAVALRLPALVFGWLCIPASWLAARVLYGRLSGVLTAGCVTALPTFVEFSVNARGYSLQWLCFLGMVTCAAVLETQPSLRLAWLGFVLSGVAGLYCIPTILIPIGGLALWMLLTAAAGGGLSRLRELAKRLAWAGSAMALLSALLYLPPVLVSGPSALAANQYVARRATPFLDGLGPLAQATWLRWTDGVPAPITWVLLLGVGAGLFLHRRVSNSALPMTVLLWACSFGFAWAHNVTGYPRVWSFLLLAAIMTAAAGIGLPIRLVGKSSQAAQMATAGAFAVLLAAGEGTLLVRERLLFKSNETVAMTDTAQIVEFLRGSAVHSGEALVVTAPATPIVQYALLHLDRKLYTSLAPLKEADRVVAVVAKPDVDSEAYRSDQLLATLAAEDAADPLRASALMDLSDYSPPRLLAKFLSVTVYSFDHRAVTRQGQLAK